MLKFLLIIILSVGSSFAFSQTKPAYEVYALRYASHSGPTPISNWAAGGPEKDSIVIDFMIWLITDKKGKNILVDAGCSMDLPNAVDFGLTKFTRPDSVLLQMNIKPEEITDIIISHPHWDHIDGINLFPNAQIWIQRDDYNYFVGQAWQKNERSGGFAKRDILTLVDKNVSGKVTMVNGDNKETFPGIKVFTGSRHTFNSQYVQVSSGNDRIVIASDNIWIYYNLEKMLPAPSYGTFDAKGYVAAMKRMKILASKTDFIIPGHDPKLFAKFPKVNDNVIKIK